MSKHVLTLKNLDEVDLEFFTRPVPAEEDGLIEAISFLAEFETSEHSYIQRLREAITSYLRCRKPIEKTLGLKRKQGGDRALMTKDALERATHVLTLCEEEGMTRPDAVGETAEKFHKDESTVERNIRTLENLMIKYKDVI